MTNLSGKTAIVTGGGRDIGRAISLQLAADGANVVVNYAHDEKGAAATVQEIEAAGGKAIAVKADLTSAADVAALVRATTDAYGNEIAVLVNNAGGMVARKSLSEMDDEFFDHVMRLNVTSTFMVTQAVAPHMPEGAAIVNLASQAGRDGGGPGAAAYASAKGAVMTFTRAMAKELGPKGVRVNSLCPGMIATSFHDTFTKDEVRANVANSTPLRRQGDAKEIAAAVAYLASDKASFITGANIDINGGLAFS